MSKRAMRVTVLMLLGFVTSAANWSCSPFQLGHRQAAPEQQKQRQLAVDTTVVIIRVFNYQPTDVTVYLDTPADRQRIGSVTPMHEAFFVLPSSTLASLDQFILTVIPVEDGIKPYRTGLIARNPNRITMVYVAVGDESRGTGDRVRPGGNQNWAPAS